MIYPCQYVTVKIVCPYFVGLKIIFDKIYFQVLDGFLDDVEINDLEGTDGFLDDVEIDDLEGTDGFSDAYGGYFLGKLSTITFTVLSFFLWCFDRKKIISFCFFFLITPFCFT